MLVGRLRIRIMGMIRMRQFEYVRDISSSIATAFIPSCHYIIAAISAFRRKVEVRRKMFFHFYHP